MDDKTQELVAELKIAWRSQNPGAVRRICDDAVSKIIELDALVPTKKKSLERV
tara:strand:+ start:268 stop:426 length:159 start_codon:yes stop_codon:yes gene_type:complete